MHFPKRRSLLSAVCLLLFAVPAVSQQDSGTKTPPWLQLSFEQRTRYEHLTNPFRLNAAGTEKHFPLRTRLRLEIGEDDRSIRALVELQDSRVLYEGEKLYSARSNINELDFLQAHLQFNVKSFPAGNLKSEILLGRFTMDLGKRRLVARNNMRNTTNAFDGVSWILTGNRDWTLRTFLSRPVTIEPYSLDSSSRRYFWGADFESKRFPKALMDAYYFGLRDPENAASRQRLTTVGGRLYKMPASGSMDYEIEAAWQFGKNSTLDHSAWLYHAEAGISFKTTWEPRFSLYYDYASGDGDPEDERSGRFDTLYGARSFEYSPTGIYGPIYRSNINTPGIKIELNPFKNLSLSVGYRNFRLAQAKDAWVGSGLRDASGNSGKSLGQNLDIRVRWKTSRYLTIESGYSHLFKGSYLDLAPDSQKTGDSNYFFIETNIKAEILPL